MKRLTALVVLLAVSATADAHGPVRRFVANVRNRVAERVERRTVVAVEGFYNPVPQSAIPQSIPVPMPSAGTADFKKLAADPSAAGRFQLRKRIQEFREGVKAELKKRGFDADDITIVGQLGDGKILEWIILHGPDIIKFVEMLIALFG